MTLTSTFSWLDEARLGTGHRIVTPAPGVLARIRGAFGHAALDRVLAEGDNVAGSPELTARAWQITRPRARARLANALERLLSDAERPRSAICVEELEVARAELRRLSGRLRDPRPVRARGVALVRLLLSDRHGPLYTPMSNDDLWRQARRAGAELD
jgi:hypothetical protein